MKNLIEGRMKSNIKNIRQTKKLAAPPLLSLKSVSKLLEKDEFGLYIHTDNYLAIRRNIKRSIKKNKR